MFLFLKASRLSVNVTTTINPRGSSTTITKIRHQHVTYESNTSTIGKNIFIFHMQIVYGYTFTSSYQEGRAVIPLPCITPPHVCACSKLGPGFPTSYVVVFLMFNDLWREMVVRFIDIDGMVGHLYLSFHVETTNFTNI